MCRKPKSMDGNPREALGELLCVLCMMLTEPRSWNGEMSIELLPPSEMVLDIWQRTGEDTLYFYFI